LGRLRSAGLLGSLVAIPLACSGQDEPPIVRGLDPNGKIAGGGGTSGSDGLPGAGTENTDTGGRSGIVVKDAGTGAIDQMGLSGGGGAGGENSCAGEEHPAELVPIDMFIMLDRSLSMYAKTSAGVTKWDAITQALEAFVSDPNSDGIGVGLQYFPTNAPCTDDKDCSSGFCFLKACRNSRSNDPKLPGLIPCVRDVDCPAEGDTCVDVGGCGDQSCVTVSAETPVACENGEICTGLTQGVCTSETVCTLGDYTKAEVDIAQLPGVKDAFIESIKAFAPGQSPYGLTPTGPALEGAITYARAWAEAHPTRRAIVVLATDGAPTGGCTPSRRSEIAALASVGAGAAVPVRTYTIGVFASVDPNNPSEDATEGPDNIRAIATAGNGEAFVISDQADVAEQFVKALNSVRGHGLACEYQVPKPEQGKLLDYGKVNVAFTPKAGDDAEIVPYVDTPADCAEDGGWYYVRETIDANPSGIAACPVTCRRLIDSVTGNVNIQVGCETIRHEPIK
jgi:hypothetical protein